MSPFFVALPGNEDLAGRLAAFCGGGVGKLEVRDFPDGESYLRFLEDMADRNLVLVCTLAQPNAKIMPLIFAARASPYCTRRG
jgi:ribose-phosphate pyrophosphokinase